MGQQKKRQKYRFGSALGVQRPRCKDQCELPVPYFLNKVSRAAVCAMTTRDSMQAGGGLNLARSSAFAHRENYCQGKSCCRFGSVEGS